MRGCLRISDMLIQEKTTKLLIRKQQFRKKRRYKIPVTSKVQFEIRVFICLKKYLFFWKLFLLELNFNDRVWIEFVILYPSAYSE